MAEPLRLIKNDPPRDLAGFVATEAARDMLRTLRKVADLGCGTATMIAGVSGCGKSSAIQRFLQEGGGATICRAVSGEGGVWGAAHAVMTELDLGRPNSRDLALSRSQIADRIGPTNVLLFDDAHHLIQRNGRGKDNTYAFQWLMKAAEDGAFSIVFTGNLELLNVLCDVPLYRPVVIRRVTREDVAAYADARGLTDPKIIDALAGAAARAGGLHNVDNVIRDARILAEGQPITLAHVLFTIEDLKLTAKGAR